MVKMIQTDEGEKAWRPMSERVERFNKDFPVKDGYRVILKQQDALNFQRGLLSLYETAIKSGQAFDKLGLPPLKDVTTMIVEAALLNKDGTVIAVATAAGEILGRKDWERLETAARQRLLAALGYHGEVLDADEDEEIARMGGTGANVVPIRTAETSEAPSSPPQPTAETAPVAVTSKADGDAKPVVPEVTTEPATTAAVATIRTARIPPSVMNQIRRLCKKRGIEVPELTTTEDALRYLAQLNSQEPASAGTGVQ